MAKLLRLIERQAETCDRASAPDLPLLRLAFQYLQNYPDLLHHPKEDALYDRLISRQSALRADIADIRQDHLRLAEETDAVSDLVANAEARSSSWTELADALHRFVSHYRRHMTVEEAELFPQARLILNEGDWAEIDADVAPGTDPLFDGAASRQYEKLLQALLRGGA